MIFYTNIKNEIRDYTSDSIFFASFISTCKSLTFYLVDLSQFWSPMRASTVVGLKELRNEFRILFPVLNADSDDTVDTKIINISLAIQETI